MAGKSTRKVHGAFNVTIINKHSYWAVGPTKKKVIKTYQNNYIYILMYIYIYVDHRLSSLAIAKHAYVTSRSDLERAQSARILTHRLLTAFCNFACRKVSPVGPAFWVPEEITKAWMFGWADALKSLKRSPVWVLNWYWGTLDFGIPNEFWRCVLCCEMHKSLLTNSVACCLGQKDLDHEVYFASSFFCCKAICEVVGR